MTRKCDNCVIVNCPIPRIKFSPLNIVTGMTEEEMRDDMCESTYTEKGTK